jgi:hypothetical protein
VVRANRLSEPRDTDTSTRPSNANPNNLFEDATQVCTPDFQGRLIYLAVVAQLGAAQPRFSARHPPMKPDQRLAGQLLDNGPVVWIIGLVFHCHVEHIFQIWTAPPPHEAISHEKSGIKVRERLLGTTSFLHAQAALHICAALWSS